MKRFLIFILVGCLLISACGEFKPELKTLQLQVGQSIALQNKNYPQASFELNYVVNRPNFNDFYMSYVYPTKNGIQKNESLSECDGFPYQGVLGPSIGEITFRIPYTCYPNYVEVNFPPGWTLIK